MEFELFTRLVMTDSSVAGKLLSCGLTVSSFFLVVSHTYRILLPGRYINKLIRSYSTQKAEVTE